MAVSEDDIIRDESERSNLQRAIADLETAIAVSNPGTRQILEASLAGAKARISTLDKKISDAIHEREVETQRQALAVAALAQKEAALSESEKEIYSGFLAKEFFTKQDFKSLDQFYAKSWDRLTDGGKDEMSHRVWEGVRHGEYEFKDLPKVIQEKEAKRLYSKLSDPSRERTSLDQISDADRTDFMRACEAGSLKQIGDVLARDAFRRNGALETPSQAKHQAVNAGKAADDQTILARNDSTQPAKALGISVSAAAGKFDAINLDGITLVDSTKMQSVADMPNAASTRGDSRSPG